jgi:hypothetical protein
MLSWNVLKSTKLIKVKTIKLSHHCHAGDKGVRGEEV